MNDFYSRLSYSFCNEDWRSEHAVLKIRPKDRILCITASGDRPLHLLLKECEAIDSVDKNPCQNALLSLKLQAMRSFPFKDYLAFLGGRECSNRSDLFFEIASKLSEGDRQFWKKNLQLIEKGVIFEGAMEKWLCRTSFFLNSLFGKKIRRLFSFDSIEEQRQFIHSEWDSFMWRNLFHVVLRPWIVRHSLGDPGLDNYLDPKKNGGAYFFQRMNVYLENHLARDNFFLSMIFRGMVEERAYPPYLTKEGVQTIHNRLGKLAIYTVDVIDFLKSQPENSYDCYSFSDVASYMPQEAFETLIREMIRTARPGARFCIRQFLSNHALADALSNNLKRDHGIERELEKEDACIFYSFISGEVCRAKKVISV